MLRLLKKELSLALHPVCILFLALSAMIFIPNYPFYVVFFYTGLGLFFVCLSGRENGDVAFTLSLPVAKKDVVRARFALAVLLEGLQIATAVVCALLRARIYPFPNEAGMDANVAFFGLSLAMLGVFNAVFFPIYYKNVDKVGRAFLWASAAIFVFIAAAEACAFAIPFARSCLDTPDPQFLPAKLMVLGMGAAAFAALTAVAYARSVKTFQALDL